VIRARPWGVDEEARRELLRALRFRHFKWDAYAAGGMTLLPETLVVEEALHRQVVAAVEALHQALTRFERRVRENPEALGRLGIPRALHPLIAREEERPLQCARYDLFPTEDGRLMVSEFNEDVPGGFNETEGLPELLGDPGPGCRWEARLRGALLDAFRDREGVALLYATAFSEDLQHMLILERWLTEAGHRTVLASPAHLRAGWAVGRRRPRVLGVPVDAVFRFYPGEWMPRLPNFPEWRRAAPSLPMMNPLRRLVRQSKFVFALWWEDSGLPDEDRELLRRHCPRTIPFRRELVPRLREEREQWVLKRAFGRMGDAVLMGNLTPEREWERGLEEAARTPWRWCAQERFQVRPLDFAQGPLFPALGAFVVNGRFAGYYSRAAPRPFLTHEAFHVATVVQAA
jgi:glutathionylspermidine synthase